ncbi:hypothetical protein IF1G_07838 [Cordyceps javanica]|uniref:Uncharacterized protein n=1 Tax=Cordyceps javanica TaxID=43265 RepID=A0A545UUY5_9HYPO|nr:hypothetical protein IF1G_07838 [Cordyceps javanica]TQW05382.1 hypothetical protein IF2G_07319 [Cordyceps javanica]
MRQLHLGLGSAGYATVAKDHSSSSSSSSSSSPELVAAVFAQEHEAHEAILLAKCLPDMWPPRARTVRAAHGPSSSTKEHCRQLAALHDALAATVNDMVPRWWTDEEAGFPRRRPLTEEEEELLRARIKPKPTGRKNGPLEYGSGTDDLTWLDRHQDLGHLREYSACEGSWRPDLLNQKVCGDDGSWAENFRVSEINARFCFNGFLHFAYGSSALADMSTEQFSLVAATDGVQHDKPLHLLKRGGDDDECMVVQRQVRQHRYDVVLKRSGEVGNYPLVGTYHVVNGRRCLGIGVWRSGGDGICAASTGGS